MTGCHGWFTVTSFPSSPASEDEGDDCFGSDDVDEDDNDGSPSDDEMST